LILLDIAEDMAASSFGWHSFVHKKKNVVKNGRAPTHFM
jgi:hypothetical protein